jgi:hypothetical protein
MDTTILNTVLKNTYVTCNSSESMNQFSIKFANHYSVATLHVKALNAGSNVCVTLRYTCAGSQGSSPHLLTVRHCINYPCKLLFIISLFVAVPSSLQI